MFDRPMKTTAIKRFLEANTFPDLAALYNENLECQITVAQDGGQRIEGEYRGKFWNGYTNPITGEVWKSFRIPWGANSNPYYEDSPINYDISKHIEGAGLTGWNWKLKRSEWVGFDFDAIVGHSDKHEKRLTEKELDEVQNAIFQIPWTTLRRSTSGKGLHLYVFVDNVETANHNEHAALARSILSVMNSVTGFDFKAKLDVCGYILWIWHRKMIGTNGLELLKKGTTFTDIPSNWRDHLSVISGKRKKILPAFIQEQNDESLTEGFEELSGQRNLVKLDAGHRRLLDWIREHGYSSYWDADNNMLVTHTYFLAKAFDELSLKGIFKTLAQGTEAPNDQNCFAYPLRKGGWVVRRYSKGVGESDNWHQDGNGWTRCFYNQEPDFDTACRTYGGQLNDKGAYVFDEAEVAANAARMLGAPFEVAPWGSTRKTYLKKGRDGKLIVEVEKVADDSSKEMKEKGFIVEKKIYQKVFTNVASSSVEPETQNFDDLIRHVVSEEGVNAGWLVKSEDNWISEPLENAKLSLSAMGEDVKQIRIILGTHVFKHWTLVNRPFEPEYPGDRKWNRDSAQFIYPPNLNDDRSFPTWLTILNHCGKGLDSALQNNEWAKANGVLTGGDYLKIWIASVFQAPLMQLPYLFLYGDQGAGKSILYEALETIITPNGIKEANNALTSTGNFNGEIAQAVICYANEVDLSRGRNGSSETYNRIKNWVTALRLTVHSKGKDPYMIPNSSHWIQVANNPNYCPIFPGDSRITMIHVPLLEKTIPKTELLSRLKKEASDFIGEMLSIDLPLVGDRYNLPVIETEEKRIAQASNKTSLERFIEENVHSVPGRMILFSDFQKRFHETLPREDQLTWSKQKIGRELPSINIFTGRSRSDNQVNLINVSWNESDTPEKMLTLRDGKIYLGEV